MNKIGAVSPDTRPIAKMSPVMMLGNAIGKITLRMVCSLDAPNAKLPVRYELSMAFRASSVVRIITGRIRNPKVNEPAIMKLPKPN